jgi:hypothetical protein
MSEDATCHCDDPRDPARKLWLCGSELCKALTSKAYRNGYHYMKPYILSEVEEITEE